MGLSYLTNPRDSRGMASEEHFDGIYQCRGASQARDYNMLMGSTENLKFDLQ